MPTPKETAEQMIRTLPDDASFADIRYRLHVLDRIDQGLAELDAGKGVPHDEVMRDIAEWLGD